MTTPYILKVIVLLPNWGERDEMGSRYLINEGRSDGNRFPFIALSQTLNRCPSLRATSAGSRNFSQVFHDNKNIVAHSLLSHMKDLRSDFSARETFS